MGPGDPYQKITWLLSPGKILVKASQCKHQSRQTKPKELHSHSLLLGLGADTQSHSVLPQGDGWRHVGQRSPPGPNRSGAGGRKAEATQKRTVRHKTRMQVEKTARGLSLCKTARRGGRARCSPHPAGGAVSPAGLFSEEKASRSGLLGIFSTGLSVGSVLLACLLCPLEASVSSAATWDGATSSLQLRMK